MMMMMMSKNRLTVASRSSESSIHVMEKENDLSRRLSYAKKTERVG